MSNRSTPIRLVVFSIMAATALIAAVIVNYMPYSGGTDENPNRNDILARIGRFQNLDRRQTESDSASA